MDVWNSSTNEIVAVRDCLNFGHEKGRERGRKGGSPKIRLTKGFVGWEEVYEKKLAIFVFVICWTECHLKIIEYIAQFFGVISFCSQCSKPVKEQKSICGGLDVIELTLLGWPSAPGRSMEMSSHTQFSSSWRQLRRQSKNSWASCCWKAVNWRKYLSTNFWQGGGRSMKRKGEKSVFTSPADDTMEFNIWQEI